MTKILVIGDQVSLAAGAPILAKVRKKLHGRLGTVIRAWSPESAQVDFWMQCRVRFDAVGRKKEVVADFMQEWFSKVT